MITLLYRKRVRFIEAFKVIPTSVEMNRETALRVISLLARNKEEKEGLISALDEGHLRVYDTLIVTNEVLYDYGDLQFKVAQPMP